MSLRNRLKRIEVANQIGDRFSGDFCKCSIPTVKIFADENRPPDYPPNHCFNCRKQILMNFNKPFETVVIYPTVDGGEEIEI